MDNIIIEGDKSLSEDIQITDRGRIKKDYSLTKDESMVDYITVIEDGKQVVRKKSKITTWKPNVDEEIVTSDGKTLFMHFEKRIQPNTKKVAIYDKFFIKKNSYEKQLDIIGKYMNFFMKFYDPDDELITAYFKVKCALDKELKFTEENPGQLIDLIYEVIFTDSIIDKICRMVEDNYLDDIESDKSKQYAGKDKRHLESLEFTNEHIKILLRISFGMKIISPILFHYVTINVIKLDRDSDMIYNFYRRLFDIFSSEVNMYNKLFVYVKAKVLESKSRNALIFEQRDILGSDEYLVIHQFLRRVLISENIVKYRFNETWDSRAKKYKENIVGFQKTIIKYQLMYFLKDQYQKNLTEVTSVKNAEGLSGQDKMEMNMNKLDEGLIILAEQNVKTELKRIMRDNDFDISEEEIDYYVKNHKPSELQVQLVLSYFCKNFGSFRTTKLIGRRDYIKLLLILKKKLLLEAGCEDKEFSNSTILPYLLTGNLQNKVSTKIIRNNKFVARVKESGLYDKLHTVKYSKLHVLRPNYDIELLSSLINTTFTYVVYEVPELLGTEIEYNEDKISDEALFFLGSI